MGPVNWIAMVLAVLVAQGLGLAWFARAGGRPVAYTLSLLVVPASLIGHNFARVGAATLHAKPWLYFMMSGGFALTMVIPALVLVHARHGLPRRELLVEGGFFLAAYLAMGAVFWLVPG